MGKIFTSSAHYLLSLKTKATPPQFLSTTQRKTFIIGFVACVKSTICMATEMVSAPTNPFKYLLTYKFSQDHIELLFSCIRSKGGWNNNPNCLQMKYALRKMLMRNAITASTSQDVIQSFPCFISENITRKLRVKLKKRPQNKTIPLFMLRNLDQEQHSEFVSNVLYYITGYIISQIINRTSCPSCKSCLVSSPTDLTTSIQHNCSSATYHEARNASAFTHFIKKGGLKIPSSSVYRTVEYSEHVFKAMVSGKDGNEIRNQAKLKERMVIQVNKHFMLDTTATLFSDHEDGINKSLVEDDHKATLKCIANKYFTLRLFTYGKKHERKVLDKGKQSDRHGLNKLILFNNE